MSQILIVLPFPVFPLISGGALRGYHLVREMARAFDVRVVVLNGDGSLQEQLALELPNRLGHFTVTNVAAPNGARSLWRRVIDRARCYRRGQSLLEPTNTASLALADQVQRTIADFQPDVAVLVELESLPCSSVVRKRYGDTPVIVDMANVNHALLAQSLSNASINPASNSVFRRIRQRETSLNRFVDRIFACSVHDRDQFIKLNDFRIAGDVIPNGVDSTRCAFDPSPRKSQNRNVLFCGNLSYEPNTDGLDWFHKHVWGIVRQRCPDARLVVVGKGLREGVLTDLRDDVSVQLVGEVSELRTWYHNCGISVCPLRMGSGTRLKVLEAMSYGNPMVSTSIGCEGLDAENGETILIRDRPDEFAEAINWLFQNPQPFHELRERARSHVEKNFEWTVIGKTLASALENSETLRSEPTR